MDGWRWWAASWTQARAPTRRCGARCAKRCVSSSTTCAFCRRIPNDYHYQDIVYPVVDFFFIARTSDHDRTAALDGVASFEWLDPHAVDLEDLAFPSMRDAVTRFRGRSRDRHA